MQFSEVAFFTDEVDATAEFYERLLGVPPTHRGDGIAIFHSAGVQVLIHCRYEPTPDNPPCENHMAFSVDNVDQSVAECEANGLTVEIPPRNYDWGRSAYLRDPSGQLVELHQKSSAE